MIQPQPLTLQPSLSATSPMRVGSIDILRALTMMLMIFVNDLWSLTDIPAWLEHVPHGADGIGLADVVFPAFLFITGMSLPFAISNRRSKGDTTGQLIGHVIARTVALLIMGVFLVNGEYLNEAATGLNRLPWNVLCCLSFILIWNAYPKTAAPWLVKASKAVGIGVLLILAFLYRGGEGALPGRFSTYWWGILGLIGWSYLAGALVTIAAQNRLAVILAAWVGFAVLSMVAKAGWLSESGLLAYIPGAISGGTLAGLTVGGVLTASVFQYYRRQQANSHLTIVFLAAAVVLVGLSVYTRPFWGLSKLDATPAWLFLCSAFTIGAFMGIYWLVDVAGKGHWFEFIKPAGTDTLLCYLIPYFVYATTELLHIHLPNILLVGGVGILKSILFALLCAWITGRLNKTGIRLKL